MIRHFDGCTTDDPCLACISRELVMDALSAEFGSVPAPETQEAS